MPTGVKALIAAAIICFLIWGTALVLGIQPLFDAPQYRIVYGEGEEFFSDGSAFRKLRNESFVLLNLPQAKPSHRWWTMDLQHCTLSPSPPPRRLRAWRYFLKQDLVVLPVTGNGPGTEWSWKFAGGGASFSGDGFTCSIWKNTPVEPPPAGAGGSL